MFSKLRNSALIHKSRMILFIFFWIILSASLWGGALSNVTVSLTNSEAGATSNHTVSFQTASAIPVDGRIVIVYPSGFNVSSVSASSTSIDGTLSTSVAGQTITITRQGDGTVQNGGQTESILLTNVVNQTATGTGYTVTVDTQTNGGAPIDSGPSLTFTITPSDLGSFALGGIPASATAGQFFTSDVTVTAYDIYTNPKTDYSGIVSWSSSDPYPALLPTDNGSGWSSGQKTFSGSAFTLFTTSSQTITVQDGSVSEISSSIPVNPGSLVQLTLSNVPATTQAGQAFFNSITVTAYDGYNNIKTDYTGTVTWSSTDPHPASLPVDNGSGWSGGQKTFSGSLFALYTTASQDITAEDGVVNTSETITVTPGNLSSFELSGQPSSTQAGQAFSSAITVRARDPYNNVKTDYTGIVTWTSSDGSPFPAVLPTDDGTGWSSGQKAFLGSSFVLYNTPSQTITVTDGAVSQSTGSITVNPGAMSSLSMSGMPASVQAGAQFVSNVIVSATDDYGNMKSDYNGIVTWTSTDGSPYPAALPVDDGAGWSNGQKSFSGSSFILYNTPSHTITVQDGAISVTSSAISVSPATLGKFTLSGLPSSVQAGIPFTSGVTVTAYDGFNNLKTNYAGIVSWTSSDGTPYPASLPTDNGSGWSNGQKIFGGSSFALFSTPSQTITAQDGSVSQTSSSITVIPSVINDFVLSVSSSIVTAGIPFTLQVINARDGYQNPWTGTVVVTPDTLRNSPSGIAPTFNNVSVSSGSGQASQNLTFAENNIILQGEANAIVRTTGNLTVNPNTQTSLKIRNAGNNGGTEVFIHTMDVGEFLDLYSAGYDAYGNYRGDENTNWTSQGLTPPVNASLSPNITFTPTSSGSGSIRADDPYSGKSAYTGTITVNPGAVDTFIVNIINTQVVGQPFQITITARDALGNIATGFNGTVNLWDVNGTAYINPTVSPAFNNGVLNSAITIFKEQVNDTLYIEQTSGSAPKPHGLSNAFNVIESPGIRIVDFRAVQSDSVHLLQTVTVEQTRDWHLKMFIENLGSNAAQLDSVKLHFIVDGNEKNDYTLIYPTVFSGSGNNLISGTSSDSLLITVDVTGQDAGAATIQGLLYLSNTVGGDILEDQALASARVQSKAELVVSDILLSQPQITVSQDSTWNLKVVLFNNGESDVDIDSSGADFNTLLSFDLGSGWAGIRPDALAGGGWILEGESTDTLTYTITQSGNQTGTCLVHASVSGEEINSGETVSDNTQDAGWAVLDMVDPAELRIVKFECLAPNAPFVNSDQSFLVDVWVKNIGGDETRSDTIHIDSGSWTDFPLKTSAGFIAGGDTAKVQIPGTAMSTPVGETFITAWVRGREDNSNRIILSENDTLDIFINNAASLIVESVIPSQSQVLGGQGDPWTVEVAVRNGNLGNSNYAGIQIDTLNLKLSFYADGQYKQNDYTIEGPGFLKNGNDLMLESGTRDTLVFTIRQTGLLGGNIEIRANIAGADINDNGSVNASASGAVFVQSSPAFRIISTTVDARNQTDAGNGYVNTSQTFNAVVVVENGLSETVSQIEVELISNGSSSIHAADPYSFNLTPTGRGIVQFEIDAAGIENIAGETFTARIINGKLNSGSDAPVGPALDSLVVVFIQDPADLTLNLELSNPAGEFSTNQLFTLTASLSNQGTAGVDESGRVNITLPPSYVLDPSTPQNAVITTEEAAQWKILSPGTAQLPQDIIVTLYEIPKELNTGQNAVVAQTAVLIAVITHESTISTVLSIDSPEGAQDRTLSSSQNFRVKATLSWHKTNNISATIIPPTGYTLLENATKNVSTPEVTWLLKAPNSATATRTVYVSAEGDNELYPGQTVTADVAGMPVITVNRADLSLSMYTPDNSVSLGQEFEVTATVTKGGDADTTGTTQVILLPLTHGYATLEARIKNMVNGQASWTIKAPVEPTLGGVNIEARLYTLPLDENTSDSVYVSKRNASVAVTTVGNWLSAMEFQRPDTLSGLVLPGQEDVWLSAFTFINRGDIGSNEIVIHGLSFDMKDFDGQQVSPSDVLSGIRAVHMERTQGQFEFRFDHEFGTLSSGSIPAQDSLYIAFSRPDTIAATDTSYIAIFGDIIQDAQTVNFQLVISNGEYVDARDRFSGQRISVLDASGNSFTNLGSWKKQVISSSIIKDDSAPYLLNFPNPFGGPGKEESVFVYYLKEDAHVKFSIYTLTGRLVWSRTYLETDPQGSKGMHSKGSSAVTWDGRNDRGVRVLNGVYILVMDTAYGDIAKTKIAFIK